MKLSVDFSKLHEAVSKMSENETNSDDLELARQQAIEADLCCSKTRLKDEFRMKPKPDAEPVKFYKNDYGKSFGVYRIADCVPMRKKVNKLTEKQDQNAKRLGLQSKLNSRVCKAGKSIEKIMAGSPLVLDTETSGLSSVDQVIEIGICDLSGRVLMEQRIKPTVAISEGAFEKHGISLSDLSDSPSWPDVLEEVKSILSGRKVIIFNSGFDLAMLSQTCAAFNLDSSWLETLDVKCAMELCALAFGATNRYGSISLEDASYFAQAEWKGEAHSAIADSIMTADILNNIYQSYRTTLDQLEELK
ncbi:MULTISPECIES: 3'-5' exonuclease [unclassified Vibrio]|uniref:3'-5' exonuclease n=1 Tax=unclassified Vibrio TaxID=2614977 RepID=UPI002963F13B|nr:MULTISPECIES: 3'-5' exonuclease [unclassified Vibrio]MDW1465437.1 3'-5' exonuclease [Vibrio sp. YT-16]MDW2254883.1 3'-5' exonuclease [Vibrio sp. 1569]